MATYTQEKERQSKKQYAYQYYINKGYRPIEAAGIVGNLDIESGGFSPNVIAGTNKNKDNGSEGVAQWRLDRLDRLKARYKNPKDFDSQLDFIDWELNNTHKEALTKMREASNVEEATSAFTWNYEKPNKNLAHFDKRVFSASSLLTGDSVNDNANTYKVDRSAYIEPTPLQTESSTTEYKEPEQPKEVKEAKQDIAEKSFVEDFKSILSQQQEQINNLQNSRQTPEQNQQPEQFASDDMQDPYNYVGLDPGYGFDGEQFQDGGLKKVDEEKQFLTNYINSPLYKEKLKAQDYENPEQEIKARLKNVEETKTIYQNGKPNIIQQLYDKVIDKPYSTVGSEYLPKDKTIIVDYLEDVRGGVNLDPRYTRSHELGHAELSKGDAFHNRLNNNDVKELVSRHKVYSDTSKENLDRIIKKGGGDGHDYRADENKADLNSLRFILKDKNIYDASKEKFTKEHLKKSPNNFIKARLLKNYKEEDLIWLMNNIANNESDKSDNKAYSEFGGIIEDDRGQWAHPGEVTKINSNNITMQGVDYPVLGVSNTGHTQMMQPGGEYQFNGDYVIEYPQVKNKNRFK